MLFNSYTFLFLFLPITLIGFWFCCSRAKGDLAVLWLVACSLFFYGWWYPPYLFLLVTSVVINYVIGSALLKQSTFGQLEKHGTSKFMLFWGIAGNLAAIGYFKYSGFLSENMSLIIGSSYGVSNVVLPLAISFFTFQQIAYLIDCYRGGASKTGIRRYFLFVTFFPQLIAGPIVLQRDVMPQFENLGKKLPAADSVLPGLIFFSIGLFKKVVIADHLAIYADLAFTTINSPAVVVSLLEAWTAALTYSLQLYFDFSGYSDMALGLGLLFGIRLPLNFNSPYQAASIIDFWRRWHMTLSRFLRECLYVPLGGNRKGPSRRYVNLMIVMLLGGLWHGAGWTFVIWGGLHGVMLVINHLWRGLRSAGKVEHSTVQPHPLYRGLAVLLTFLSVTAAWVVFRAESLDAALRLYAGLFGLNGIVFPLQLEGLVAGLQVLPFAEFVSVGPTPLLKAGAIYWIALLLPFVWWAPNTQHLIKIQWARHTSRIMNRFASPAVGVAAGAAFGLAVAGVGGSVQFLYFQF